MMKRDTRMTARHTLFIDTDDAAFWLAATSFVDEGGKASPPQANERIGESSLSSRRADDVASRFAAANSVRRRPSAAPPSSNPPPLPGLVPLPVVKPLNVHSRERFGVHLASPAAIGPTDESMFASPRRAPPAPGLEAGTGRSPLSPVSPLPPPMRKLGDHTSGLLPAADIRQERLDAPASPTPSSHAPSSLLQASPRLDDSRTSTQTFSSAGLHVGATIISAFPSPPQRQHKPTAIQLIDYNAAKKLALEEQNKARQFAPNSEKDAFLRLATKPLPMPPANDDADKDDESVQASVRSRQLVASSSLDLERLVPKQAANEEFATAKTNALRPQHSYDALRQARSDSSLLSSAQLSATPPARRLISTVRSHDRSGQRSGSPAQKQSPMDSASSVTQFSYLSDTPPLRVNPDEWDLPWQQVRTNATSRHQRQASSKSSTSSSGGSTFTSSGTSTSSRATNNAEIQFGTPPWTRSQQSKGSAPSMDTIPERKQLTGAKDSPRRSPSPRRLNKHTTTAYLASAVDPFPLDVQRRNLLSNAVKSGVTSNQVAASSGGHFAGHSGGYSPAASSGHKGTVFVRAASPAQRAPQTAYTHTTGRWTRGCDSLDARHEAQTPTEDELAIGFAL